MDKAKNRIGQRFGNLVVVKREPSNKYGGAMWLCQCDCGNTKITSALHLINGHTKSCGCWYKNQFHKEGRKPNNYLSGRIQLKSGYVLLRVDDYPNVNIKGYVLEHVYIMSKYIGRPLTKQETVHHKNGIRNDNRLENLELWASKHVPGQRVEDLILFAKEILQTYEPTSLK